MESGTIVVDAKAGKGEDVETKEGQGEVGARGEKGAR